MAVFAMKLMSFLLRIENPGSSAELRGLQRTSDDSHLNFVQRNTAMWKGSKQ
jgi:hypothetical protein